MRRAAWRRRASDGPGAAPMTRPWAQPTGTAPPGRRRRRRGPSGSEAVPSARWTSVWPEMMWQPSVPSATLTIWSPRLHMQRRQRVRRDDDLPEAQAQPRCRVGQDVAQRGPLDAHGIGGGVRREAWYRAAAKDQREDRGRRPGAGGRDASGGRPVSPVAGPATWPWWRSPGLRRGPIPHVRRPPERPRRVTRVRDVTRPVPGNMGRGRACPVTKQVHRAS
jgi:hypothetical protein